MSGDAIIELIHFVFGTKKMSGEEAIIVIVIMVIVIVIVISCIWKTKCCSTSISYCWLSPQQQPATVIQTQQLTTGYPS